MSLEPEGDCIGFQLQHDEVLCPLHEFPGMKMMPRRHPASERLHELLQEMGALHDRKQKDYGTATDPFANVRGSLEFGVRPWVGAMIRLNDKVKRLQSHAQGSPLANEGALDSMMDIAVYALIAYVLYEQDALATPRPEGGFCIEQVAHVGSNPDGNATPSSNGQETGLSTR